jgi:hypothetical protein
VEAAILAALAQYMDTVTTPVTELGQFTIQKGALDPATGQLTLTVYDGWWTPQAVPVATATVSLAVTLT